MKLKDFEGMRDMTGETYSGTDNIRLVKVGLSSLEGAPKEMTKAGFYVYINKELTSLEHCPEYVAGVINVAYTSITSLEYCAKKIGIKLICNNNPQLKNQWEQILKYKIVSKEYITDDGEFTDKDYERDLKTLTIQRKGFRTLLGFNK